MSESQLDLVVAGTRDSIVMIEAGAAEVDKSILIGGLKFAQEGIRQIIDLIAELKEKVGRPKAELPWYHSRKSNWISCEIMKTGLGRHSLPYKARTRKGCE